MGITTGAEAEAYDTAKAARVSGSHDLRSSSLTSVFRLDTGPYPLATSCCLLAQELTKVNIDIFMARELHRLECQKATVASPRLVSSRPGSLVSGLKGILSAASIADN
jgi:hypothetical protein